MKKLETSLSPSNGTPHTVNAHDGTIAARHSREIRDRLTSLLADTPPTHLAHIPQIVRTIEETVQSLFALLQQKHGLSQELFLEWKRLLAQNKKPPATLVKNTPKKTAKNISRIVAQHTAAISEAYANVEKSHGLTRNLLIRWMTFLSAHPHALQEYQEERKDDMFITRMEEEQRRENALPRLYSDASHEEAIRPYRHKKRGSHRTD